MSTDSPTPLCISGIYPHLAVWNHPDDPQAPNYQQPECGIGAVVPWAGKLWFLSYTSHDLHKGPDKLYTIDSDMRLEARPESVGGTHAGRLIHKESQQLFIGCYVIDQQGNVRVIDRTALPGRLTAIARHLTDPENKLYFYSQECSLYEVDVHTLDVNLLFKKPVAGWHAKGACTGQGVLVVGHNGEEIAPSPYWEAFYREPEKTLAAVKPYLQTPTSNGPDDMGVLAEWDGKQWREICRNQFNDVNSFGGLTADAPTDAPIWAQGWDKRSVLIKVRHRGEWTTWRLPKGSFTYDGWNGSYTEWPRFADIGEQDMLMIMHGTLFSWPKTFSPENPTGIEPLATYQRMIPDISVWKGKLVLAGQDTSRIGIPWTVPGHPHSNLQFVTLEEWKHWGPRTGYGDIWQNDTILAHTPSDPFLVNGYEHACLHLSHKHEREVVFHLEIHNGDTWAEAEQISVKPDTLSSLTFAPSAKKTQWLRLSSSQACVATASLHLVSKRTRQADEDEIFAGIATATDAAGADGGILQVPVHNHNLQLLLDNGDYYEIDERLEFEKLDAPDRAADVRQTAGIETHVFEDNASLVAVSADGQRLRFPKSPDGRALSQARDVREVVQERFLANLGGTFYEVPRYGVDQPYDQRNLPDYRRMRPICSHGKAIRDYVVWRGLLVLSGVDRNAPADGHVFRAAQEGPALWFGGFDDLWRLGAPVGIGGPWKNTPVAANVPSDPYLMTGFDRKELTLRHNSRQDVSFLLELDVNNTGVFQPYSTIQVPSTETVVFRFPEHFCAHWLRLTPDHATVATAQLVYE
jgi:hypothetical protein